jgi:hypothetical protein
MSKIKFLSLVLIFVSFKIYALVPYKAVYDLYADTNLGNYNIGIADFILKVRDDEYTYSTNAKTKSMWSALYKFSRYEKSTGINTYNQFISSTYSISEQLGDNTEKNIQIDFFPEKNYATYNNKTKWKIAPGTLVDELSVYLALSQDIQNNPSIKKFTYQVALEDKVKFQTFFITGLESINLNDNLIETIIVSCPDLNLTLKLSKEHNFLPVYISKVNKKNNFIMVLSSFELTS